MAVTYVLLPVKLLLYEDDFPGSRWATAIGTFLSHFFFGGGGNKLLRTPAHNL